MTPDDEFVSPEDEESQRRLQHEEGVLSNAEGGREVECEPDKEACAPSDFTEEPFDDDGTPGAPDDLPYTLGQETSPAADLRVDGPGIPPAARAPEEETEDETAEERELWERQQTLLGQDEEIGAGLEDLSEADGKRVLDALGDDAAESLPDWPEGTSATGAGGRPDHGGFPDREE